MGKHFEKLLKDREELIQEINRIHNFLTEQAGLPVHFRMIDAGLPVHFRKIDTEQFTLMSKELELRVKLLEILDKRIEYDKEKKKNDIH